MRWGNNSFQRKIKGEVKKKKTRRTKKIKNKLKMFRIVYSNIRGLKSKIDSLSEIIEDLKPAVVAVVETHLIDSDIVQLEGYETIYRNNKDSNSGGVLIAVKDELKNIVTEVNRQKDIEQSIWILLDNKKVSVRLGVIYAPQETRTEKKDIKKMYKNIEEQNIKADELNQHFIVIGDLNAKVGDIIPGNKAEVSKAGKELKNFIKKNKVKVLNSSPICQGLWTRVEGNAKSVIDYVLVKEKTEDSILNMIVDEDRLYTPFNFMSKEKIIYSDHNTLIVDADLIKGERKKIDIRKIITKKGYDKIGKEIKEKKLSEIWRKDDSVQNLYDEWTKRIEEIVTRNKIIPKKINRRKDIRSLIKAKRNIKKERKKE